MSFLPLQTEEKETLLAATVAAVHTAALLAFPLPSPLAGLCLTFSITVTLQGKIYQHTRFQMMVRMELVYKQRTGGM